MAVVSTPLGFQKPDGNEPMRNVDDIIAVNAQKSQDLLGQLVPDVDALKTLGGLQPGDVSDATMTVVANDPESSFSGALDTRVDGRIVASARVVDPATYSVPVDGVADATSSFQAMLNALPAGAVVQARYGQKFKITAPLNLSKPVTIRGKGVEFLANPTGVTFLVAADDVSLMGFDVKGPGAALGYEPAQRFVGTTGTTTARINRLHISGLKLTQCQYTALYLEWVQDVVVERCTVETFQYGGIVLLSPKRGLVTRNTVRTALMASPLVNAYGIMASDTASNGGNTVAGRAEDVTISKNYVEGIPAWEGIDTHGGKNIKILGNTVRSCRTPIAVTGGNSTRVVAPNGFVIAGNYVEKGDAPTETAGIFVDGANSTTLADGTVGHNVIRGFTTDLYLADYSAAKTSVAPQSTDATTIRSPHAAPYRSWGVVTTVSISNGAGTSTLNFPAGMFNATPVIQVTRASSSGAKYIAYVTGVTTTGCTVGLYDPTQATQGTISVPVYVTVNQYQSNGNGTPAP